MRPHRKAVALRVGPEPNKRLLRDAPARVKTKKKRLRFILFRQIFRFSTPGFALQKLLVLFLSYKFFKIYKYFSRALQNKILLNIQMTARVRWNLIQKIFILFGYSSDRTRQAISDINLFLKKYKNIK